jgi:RimJ/RimL family protein N-acetyltransferase
VSRSTPRIALPSEPLVEGPTTLRIWRESDLEALVAICQDPTIGLWTGVPHPYTEEDGRSYLRQRHDAALAGMTAGFAIVASDDGHLLGSISLLRIAWEHARGEVGYWLGADARGQGHATRAVRLICAWGFASLRLERIDLLAATGNGASQRVAQRTGFTREAVLRSYLQAKHERQDVVAYGRLAGELPR